MLRARVEFTGVDLFDPKRLRDVEFVFEQIGVHRNYTLDHYEPNKRIAILVSMIPNVPRALWLQEHFGLVAGIAQVRVVGTWFEYEAVRVYVNDPRIDALGSKLPAELVRLVGLFLNQLRT